MFQEPDESNDLLREATMALRGSRLPQEVSARGEEAILQHFKGSSSKRFHGLLLAAGLSAAAIGAAVFLMPSKSYAAELNKIVQNGETGMRHVSQFQVQPDGSCKLVNEYYADGNRSRMIYSAGVQSTFNDGRWTTLFPDGTATIEDSKYDSRWMSYSAKAILKVNDTPGTKISLDHVTVNGAVLERFTSDSDFIDGRGQKLHCHFVLTADPVSERDRKSVV